MRQSWMLLLGLLAVPAASARSELWLAPQSLQPAPLASDEDFLRMFTPAAPWQTVAAHTQVFKLYSAFAVRSPQAEIDKVVQDLKRRHIAIALETGILDVSPKPAPPCGGLGIIEGYGTAPRAKLIAEKIKAAGGEIKYVVMDEPLYYGHFSSKPHTCHSPIAVLLQQMAPTIRAFQQEFPDIVIGEVEPTRLPEYNGWRADLHEWLSGARDVIGQPVAFMQLDIPWSDDGKKVPGTDRISHEPGDAAATYEALRNLERQNLVGGIGIIHDGTPVDASDAEWTQDARDHILLVEGEHGLCPDQDVFQSWQPHPSHALPEDQRDTLTGLVKWFLDQRSDRKC